MLFHLGVPAFGQSAPTEYEVKAAYLFNFAKFIEWPTDVLADASPEIVITFLGKDPFGPECKRILGGETVRNWKIVVNLSENVEDLKGSHIVFVSSARKKDLPVVLKTLAGTSTLTISDVEGFCEQGGMIRLYTQEGKIRFEINLEEAKKVNLKISSKLLKIARIVATKEDEEKESG